MSSANPDQEHGWLRGQAASIMREVGDFGVTASDPLNAVRLLIARVDELEKARALPTTADTEVIVPERSKQRALTYRLEEMRSAVIAARVVVGHAADLAQFGEGEALRISALAEAAARWLERYGKLADPPLEVEVEDDEDPADTPTEGAWWEKESETGR